MKTVLYDLGTMAHNDELFYIELLEFNENNFNLTKVKYLDITFDELVKYLDSNGTYNLDHLDNVYSRVSVSDYKDLLEYGYYSFDDFNIIIESFDGTKHFNKLCEIFQY